MLSAESCCCHAEHLTEREVDAVALAAHGFTDGQIASRLHISVHTVGHYFGQALNRTGSSSRTELVAKCYAWGILVSGSWPPLPSGRRCLPRPG